MNPESESFLKEVRDFYWQYLQEYAKKGNASIEHINEGIELLERLETSRVVLCEGEPPKEDTSSEMAMANEEFCQKMYRKMQQKFPNPLKFDELP